MPARAVSLEQLLEPPGVVEGADDRQVRTPIPDQIPCDALDVLCCDLVELAEDLLGIRCRALEHLAAQAEHDQALRRLQLEDEATFREALGLVELVLRDRLFGD